MDYDNIKDLIDTIVNTDIMSFELNYNGVDVKIDRNKKTYSSNEIKTVATEKTVFDEVVKPIVKTPTQENTFTQNIAEAPKDGKKITAPIVGTFYAANSPESDPFIKVGSKVKKGDVLFIIEAMKVINEITSDFDGEVLEILAKDGELLEYDQCVVVIG